MTTVKMWNHPRYSNDGQSSKENVRYVHSGCYSFTKQKETVTSAVKYVKPNKCHGFKYNKLGIERQDKYYIFSLI